MSLECAIRLAKSYLIKKDKPQNNYVSLITKEKIILIMISFNLTEHEVET